VIKVMKSSKRGLSRPGEYVGPLISRDALPGALLALAAIGGPFLLTVTPLLFLYALGLAGSAVALAVFWTAAFTSYFVIPPLSVGLVSRNRRRRQEIAGEMMIFFSARIIGLYRLDREVPAVADDPRAAEAFALYSRAGRLVEENIQAPLCSRRTIEHGVYLVDELLEDYGAPRSP
jgi:hypothetical protein